MQITVWTLVIGLRAWVIPLSNLGSAWRLTGVPVQLKETELVCKLLKTRLGCQMVKCQDQQIPTENAILKSLGGPRIVLAIMAIRLVYILDGIYYDELYQSYTISVFGLRMACSTSSCAASLLFTHVMFIWNHSTQQFVYTLSAHRNVITFNHSYLLQNLPAPLWRFCNFWRRDRSILTYLLQNIAQSLIKHRWIIYFGMICV